MFPLAHKSSILPVYNGMLIILCKEYLIFLFFNQVLNYIVFTIGFFLNVNFIKLKLNVQTDSCVL